MYKGCTRGDPTTNRKPILRRIESEGDEIQNYKSLKWFTVMTMKFVSHIQRQSHIQKIHNVKKIDSGVLLFEVNWVLLAGSQEAVKYFKIAHTLATWGGTAKKTHGKKSHGKELIIKNC